MDADKKQVEDFEKEYKDAIFSKIIEVHSKQFDNISQISENARNLGQSLGTIHDTSVTVNNKLVELSQQFRKAGISMFSKKIEDLGFVGSSFVGSAIIHDLMDKLETSIEKLTKYVEAIDVVSSQKNERLLALANISPIKKFFLRIKALFVPIQFEEFSLTEEERGLLDSTLQEYMDINFEIWNYSLEENIVQALVKKIAGPRKLGDFDIPHRYLAFIVPGLLKDSVIPDLKALGLEHLIPQLQEALIEEYKKDLPDPEVYKVEDEDMYLYVPDFSQKPDNSDEPTEDLQDMYQQTQEAINVGNNALRSIKEAKDSGGLDLKSFESIDIEVPAVQRKEAIEVISTELLQDQSEEPVKNENENEFIIE